MSAVLEAEHIRLAEQQRLDQSKSAGARNKWGQFATPPALALDIARAAWRRLRRRKDGFRFLDPAVGTGSFYGAFLQVFPHNRIETATGIELDVPFAQAAETIWHRQGLQVIHGDFTRQQPNARYNVILTNPPYVRHHHLKPEEKRRLGELCQHAVGLRPNGLSGLYCYFLLIAHDWLDDDGLAVWLIPSEFMDVNYGDTIRRYLTERVSLLQVHRFNPNDLQFNDALVSSAVVIFQKHKPCNDHEAIFSFGGSLTKPDATEHVSIDELRTGTKWNSFNHSNRKTRNAGSIVLGDLFQVKRGVATGNNDFFIVPRNKLQELGIPPECVCPILPSPRFLRQETVEADADGWPMLERQLGLIDCNLDEEEIRRRWPRFAEYLETGKQQDIHQGYITSRRRPWYSQEKRKPTPFVCTYMGRSREKPFRFIWNRSRATAANVYLLLYPKPHVARAIMNKIEQVFRALREIQPEHFRRQGRVYGGGLYKMEPAELMRLPADGLAKLLGVKPDKQRPLF